MFSQAMKHDKPTNVRLINPSCDHTPCGTTAHAHHLKMPLKMPLLEVEGLVWAEATSSSWGEIVLHVVSCKIQLLWLR